MKINYTASSLHNVSGAKIISIHSLNQLILDFLPYADMNKTCAFFLKEYTVQNGMVDWNAFQQNSESAEGGNRQILQFLNLFFFVVLETLSVLGYSLPEINVVWSLTAVSLCTRCLILCSSF